MLLCIRLYKDEAYNKYKGQNNSTTRQNKTLTIKLNVILKETVIEKKQINNKVSDYSGGHLNRQGRSGFWPVRFIMPHSSLIKEKMVRIGLKTK